MPSALALLRELRTLRGAFGPEAARRKCDIFAAFHPMVIRSASRLIELHAAACFFCAFPDSAAVYRAAHAVLAAWADRQHRLKRSRRESMLNTGMAGTRVYYEFSYDTLCQLDDRFPGALEINWDEYESPEKLDAILIHMIGRAEEHAFEEELGEVSTQEWMAIAKGNRAESDLTWLLRQTRRSKPLCTLAPDLFDEAEVPVVWRIGDTPAATTNNALDVGRTVYRSNMRKPPKRTKREIATPLRGIRRLGERRGRAMIDVAVAALAARQREVYAMTRANPREVYLAPLGEGTHAAIIGVKPAQRLHLEGNYGFVILANGRPVGYGGISPLFRQGNTGINIFPEYRGAEAAYLFVQLLRAFHMLFGTTRFLANPYQFGRGNAEAIQSGAFWFYYKLGFRPVDGDALRLAQRESRKILSRRGYRTDAVTLRRLAKSDLHLTLRHSKKSEYFQERWLTACAIGATAAIAAQPGRDRASQMRRVVRRVTRSLGVRGLSSWSANHRRALYRLAPTVALIRDLDQWTRAEKRALVEIIRAKADPAERAYVLLLGKHPRLRASLAKFCKHATAQGSADTPETAARL